MAHFTTKEYKKEHMAKASGRGLPISFKQTVEVSSFIRGKKLLNAKEALRQVISMKKAVPFKRFNKGVGHRKDFGAGRYPVKVAQNLLALLESAEANGQFKGLNTSNLYILHLSASKGGKTWHYGRKRGRKMKRTNVEVVLDEKAEKKKKDQKREPKKDVEPKKVEKKVETKIDIKKEEKKPEQKEDIKLEKSQEKNVNKETQDNQIKKENNTKNKK